LLKLNARGVLSELLDVQQHEGNGTTDRQEAPHAHSAWFSPNSNEVISVDLGTNELWFSLINTKTNKFEFLAQKKLTMKAGAGPRHLTFHPNGKWIYVLNELNGTCSMIQKNKDGIYEVKNTYSTLPVNFTEFNKCADIHITKDGRYLYASNRGHNSIVIFSINSENGTLTTLAFELTRGDGPRNFALSPDEQYLLVANQYSHNIIAFKRNSSTGLLTFMNEIAAPEPICLLFE